MREYYSKLCMYVEISFSWIEDVGGVFCINGLIEGWKNKCLFSILLSKVIPDKLFDLLNAVYACPPVNVLHKSKLHASNVIPCDLWTVIA